MNEPHRHFPQGRCHDCGERIPFAAERCADCVSALASGATLPHTPNARGMPTTIDELRASVAAMRELGVTKWNGIELGPTPQSATDGTDTDQPSGLTVDERMRATRAERQRVASLASGGPVPAVGSKQ